MEGTADRASELKQQGALEAARDPNSSVNAAQAQKTVLHEARAAGAAAYSFDPNATPEEKRRQLQDQSGVGKLARKHQTAALASDQDDGETAGYDLPPPSKDGVVALASSPAAGQTNGHIAVEEDSQWAKVGFGPRFGNPWDAEEDTRLDHQTFLEGKLDDKFFGDWYHNAGVIVFACISSWVIAALGGGIGYVIIILAICATYYRTSIRRVRRNFRDDMTRELAKNRLETDTESLEWINSFLVKFWPIYAPVLCQTIVASVDQVLSTSTPAFLDSMRMSFFTLGTKPPRLEHVKTYPKAEDDTVLMDWKFSFTPNDTADMTARQIKVKVNPKVILEVRIGKGVISKGLDIIVEDMACSGLMRVRMKLQIPFPHIDRVEICFLGKPTFDYKCKPLGGEHLGFDINFVPGLEGFIQEQIHANLGPMMYDPNVFPIEIAKMLAGNPVDQAIGVLQVTFHGAHDLKNPDKFSGTPDPYAVVSINNREPLGRTKTVTQNANPRWGDTVNIILTSLREPLTLHVFDYNEVRKDKELGVCTFPLEQLEQRSEHENLQLEVLAQGRARGALQADIRFFPVLQGQKLADGTVEPPPESMTGVAKFTVEQAKDLDGTKSLIGQLNPYAVLLLNGKEVQTSKKLKRTNNPIWDNATKELLITNRKAAKLGLVIKDDRELGTDPILGSYQIKLDDMLDLTGKGQEWYNLAGAQTGRAKMMLQWKPVALKGALSGSGGYVTPIGVVRLHFQSAQDLKNLDTLGKSDPYVRVLLSGVRKGRTVTILNELNPQWDEVIYVPVHSTRERLVVECMDEEDTGKDRTLGQFEILASELIHQGEKGEYLANDAKHEVRHAQLRMGTGAPKGTLNFTSAFYPCLNVVDPAEEEEGEDPKLQTAVNGTSTATAPLAAPVTPAVPNGVALHATETVGGAKKTVATAEEKEMQKALATGERDQTETDDVQTAHVPKIRIGAGDLSKYESGLLVFKILEGQLAYANTYLEVLIDDMLFPAYSSAKAQSTKNTYNETSDAMIRELDLSKITLRLVSALDRKGEGKDSSVKAKLTGNTLETLRKCLYTPTQITLKDAEGRDSKITVSMRFLPVEMKLDPSESYNNQGNLRVEVLDAADLPAADRNGYSDPFCKFNLAGKEVYKTKVQKKTLHPAWNEFFDVPIRSRTNAQFKVEVMDWDLADKPDFLGAAEIPLGVLEPFQAKEITLPLDGKSGVLRLKMVFKPDYVTRTRQGTPTFSGTFGTPGKIVGAPVKGIAKGVGMVGSGAVSGVSKSTGAIGSMFKRRTTSGAPGGLEEINGAGAEAQDTSMDVPSGVGNEATNGTLSGHASQLSTSGALTGAAVAGAGATALGGAGVINKELPTTPLSHQRQRSFQNATPSSPGAEYGMASIVVVSASGFEGEPKLEIHVMNGSKEVFRTEHQKTKGGEAAFNGTENKVSCAADAQFQLLVKEKKTFSSDPLGAPTPFYVNDQARGGEQTVVVQGQGKVVLRTSFQPAEAGSFMDSPASRKGGVPNRLFGRKERSVTPSG